MCNYMAKTGLIVDLSTVAWLNIRPQFYDGGGTFLGILSLDDVF